MTDFDPFDVRYGRLIAPVSVDEVKRLKSFAKKSTVIFPAVARLRVASAINLCRDIVLWLVMNAIPGFFIALSFGADNAVEAIALGTTGFGFVAVVTWWVFKDVRKSVHLSSPWRRWVKLTRFGLDNGLLFLPVSSRPQLGGILFTGRERGAATDRLVSTTGRRFEVGNYNYGTGDGSSWTKVWGYMAIGLDRALPHMILRAVANKKGKRGLPGKIAKDQVLSLEGDFNKYFTLHAPRAYETDALYVFSPDLMALMIDEVAAFEVEILDDWIIFYSPQPFDLSQQRTVSRLMRIASIVGTKTFRQTDHYADERVESFQENRVATPGQRLRVRFAIGSLIFTGIWIALQLVRLILKAQELGVGH